MYNNPEIIYNKRKQTTESNYLISAICAFDDKQNKNDKYGGQDCMQKFCKDLKKHWMEIINYEKTKWHH